MSDTTTGEPLSDERLAAALTTEELESFRQMADDARYLNTFWSGQYAWTVARLLTEVERLRAREAALVAEREQAMAIIRRVARIIPLTSTPGAPGGGVFHCPFCGEQPFKQFDNDPWLDAGWEHAPDCIVPKARAMLASSTETGDARST